MMYENTIQFIPQRRFYDTATVAETHRRLLAEGHNISENALRGLIRQGILPAVKIGTGSVSPDENRPSYIPAKISV